MLLKLKNLYSNSPKIFEETFIKAAGCLKWTSPQLDVETKQLWIESKSF